MRDLKFLFMDFSLAMMVLIYAIKKDGMQSIQLMFFTIYIQLSIANNYLRNINKWREKK